MARAARKIIETKDASKQADAPSADEQIAELRKQSDDNTAALKSATGLLEKALKEMRDRHDESPKDKKDALKEADTIDADVVHKMQATIDSLMDEQKSLRVAQEGLYGAPLVGNDNDKITQKQALTSYMRSGVMSPAEQKALTTGNDPSGGYVVFDERGTEMGRLLSEASPIRAIAQVRSISTGSYTKPFTTSGADAGWTGETGVRSETSGPTLAQISYNAMELYAMPAATQTMLDDAAIDVDMWLGEEVRIKFAEQEGAAFVNGDGVNKPHGFLAYTNIAESSYAWGKLGYIATGAGGAFDGTNPANNVIDLTYSLKAGYRNNARFVMNRATQGEIRKIKDGAGNYIWSPGNATIGANINGFAVTEAEDMPDIGANSLSIAFGDFKRGYLIVDRLGVRVLRDPYSSKPYVLFYTTKRVGGGVQDFDAIKLMKFAAS